MHSLQLSVYHAVLIICLLVGGFIVYSVVTRVRSHRRYFEQLRQQSYRQAWLQEEDRTRIAHDLHDDLGPLLSITRLHIRKGRREQDAERLTLAEANLEKAIEDLVFIARNLAPRLLQERGLKGMLEEFFQQLEGLHAIVIRFTCPEDLAFPAAGIIHLFRIVQEVVYNAIKHSGADLIEVQFKEVRGLLHIVCRDNGKGKEEAGSGGLGLNSLRLRTACLGGTLECSTAKGEGTAYLFTIPLKADYGEH